MKFKHLLLSLFTLAILTTSCSSDDDNNVIPRGDYENGIIVLNQGSFNSGNASVSFLANDFSTVENNVFETVNTELLGDTAQNIAFNQDLAYIVVNNSQKIEVVNRYTFASVASITTGFDNPRYMAIANGKGYVTNWGGYVAVIDLATNTVSSTIPVESGPEQIIVKDNLIYVSHKGGFGSNNKISVIDATTDTVTTTITVNDLPDEMFFNNQSELVVLCQGRTIYNSDYTEIIGHTDASISKINVTDNSVISSIIFNETEHPSFMAYANGNYYYLLNGKLYEMADSATDLPTTEKLTPTASYIYGMSVREGKVYFSDASFTEASTLRVYDLNSGTETNTFEVGVGASEIYFN